MSQKYNIVKTSWKLWLGFFVLVGVLLVLENFFKVEIPDYIYYTLSVIVLFIYLAGYFMYWKNKTGGK